MLGILCQTCFDIKYQLKEYATTHLKSPSYHRLRFPKSHLAQLIALSVSFARLVLPPGMSRFFLVGELLDLILCFCNLFVNVFHKLSFLYVFCLSWKLSFQKFCGCIYLFWGKKAPIFNIEAYFEKKNIYFLG